MMDERKISICCPTYNRFDMTIECFAQVIEDDRVSEIILQDDFSTDGSYEKLIEYYKDNKKVHIEQNPSNYDCYLNKAESLSYTANHFTILIDSDNIIDKGYIDAIYAIPEWDENTFYTPSFARPHFDFREFEGLVLSKENIAQYIENKKIEVCLNAANYFVSAIKYLSIFDDEINPITSDSIYMISRLFESGGKLIIVPNMEYEHRIHDGSHYRNNISRTPKMFHGELITKLKNMK